MAEFTFPLILDGAMGTRLQALGMPAGVCTARWALDNPAAVREVLGSYAAAGSGAVYAPTFGCTAPALKKYGLAGELRAMNAELAALAREAAPGCLIGGDISPTGLQLYPLGETGFEELTDIFAAQAEALEEAGVDFFGVETQMSLGEARAAFLGVRRVSQKPVAVSFTLGPSGRTIYGESLLSALLCFESLGAAAFGINCCGDLALMERVLGELKPYAAIPLIAKPNAGIPEDTGAGLRYGLTPGELAAAVPGFVAAGAYLLGGCCGTTAEHIAALREAARGLDYPQPRREISGRVAASAYAAALITEETRLAEIAVDEDICENALDAADEGAEALLLDIADGEALETLLDEQHGLRLPICVRCGDAALRSRLLREYNGVPIVL